MMRTNRRFVRYRVSKEARMLYEYHFKEDFLCIGSI